MFEDKQDAQRQAVDTDWGQISVYNLHSYWNDNLISNLWWGSWVHRESTFNIRLMWIRPLERESENQYSENLLAWLSPSLYVVFKNSNIPDGLLNFKCQVLSFAVYFYVVSLSWNISASGTYAVLFVLL